METKPVRKSPRLKGFDYSSIGAYALTINSYKYQHIFGRVEFNQTGNIMHLSDIGQIVEETIQGLHERFPEFELINYAIMPNHVHILIYKNGESIDNNRSVSDYICAFKSLVYNETRKLFPKRPIWHSRSYDHIIRNNVDLTNYWGYIEYNVDNWKKDLLFNPPEESELQADKILQY